MFLTHINVDTNLRCTVECGTPQFPMQVFPIYFSKFITGTLNWHWHPELEFSVALTGNVRFYVNDSSVLLQKGEGVFVNSNSLHMAEPADNCKDAIILAIVFAPEFIMNTASTIYRDYVAPIIENKALPGVKFSRGTTWQERILDKLNELYSLEYNPCFGYELQYHNLICTAWFELVTNLREVILSASVYTENPLNEQRAKLMMSYIHEHFSESITIDEIAASANISRSECFRCFRKLINKKPFEYLNEYRLERALKMLINTDKTITEISCVCGYKHSSYFGKLFRAKVGYSPRSYRKLYSKTKTKSSR
ncbi:MAG: AraC family transcriptional regulator [Desulfotomaculaceae bacterium]|nr:AraC family transcriptional regulator [Desulfotomaculaceae bacterium]